MRNSKEKGEEIKSSSIFINLNSITLFYKLKKRRNEINQTVILSITISPLLLFLFH